MVMQLLFAEEELTQWQWYRGTSHQASSTAATHLRGTDNTGDDSAVHHVGFEAIPGAVKRLYVPTPDDENHTLRVQCKPASRWVSIATRCTVLQMCMLLMALQFAHLLQLLKSGHACAGLTVRTELCVLRKYLLGCTEAAVLSDSSVCPAIDLLFLDLEHSIIQVWGTGREARAALSYGYCPSPAWPCSYSSSPPPPPHPQTFPCAWGEVCDVQYIGRPVHISGVFTESSLWLLPQQVWTASHCSVLLPDSRHSKPTCTKCTHVVLPLQEQLSMALLGMDQ